MICPNCNGELRIVPEQIGVDGNNLPIFHRIAYCDSCMIKKDLDEKQKDNLQVELAKKEIKKIDSDGGSKFYYIAASICGIAAIFSLTTGSLIQRLCLFSFLLLGFIYLLVQGVNVKKRKQELNELSQGKKIINVCPRCKSQNIEMNMVQTGSTTTHGVSRVSNNINPLHPLTHTNVRIGNDSSKITYGNQCICKDCGNVFEKSETLYM